MADKLFGDNELVLTAVWLVVAVAAANWALVEFVQFDLLVDGLGLREDLLTAAYAIIGGAAGVNLYNLVAVDLLGG